MIWIVGPLLAFVLFGIWVRRQAERIRADDARPRLVVTLKLAGDGMATREELHARQAIEAAIEERGIGKVADGGSGNGSATIEVMVADVAEATSQIEALLREREAFGTATVTPLAAASPTAGPQ